MKILRKRGIVPAAAALSFFCFSFSMQWHAGAFESACGSAGFPDEPSHYVSGLMIHDYLTGGMPHSPLRYAQRYYLHIPYFAVGYWPPFFYMVEALWMICFGTARTSVLLLVALISALISTLLFLTTRRSVGPLAAFGLGILFLGAPLVQRGNLAIMTDLPVALLSLTAMLVLARYLDDGRTRDAIVFSVIAAATILTKSSGFVLGTLPPLAVLLTGRVSIFKKSSFWAMPIMVTMICGPWFLLTRGMTSIGFTGIVKTFGESLAVFSVTPWRNLGILLILSMVGVVWRFTQGSLDGLTAICIVQPVVSALFFAVSPSGNEPRYMIASFPPLLILAASGIEWIAQSAGPNFARRHVLAAVVVVFVFIASVASGRLHLQGLAASPVHPVAAYVAARPYRVVLVNPDAEGPTIASIAALETGRPGDRYLVRPNKLLSLSNWMATRYEPLYRTPEEVETVLERLGVDVVVLRKALGPDALTHEVLLHQAVFQTFAERWRMVYSAAADGIEYDLFEPVVKKFKSSAELEKVLQSTLSSHFTLKQ